MTASPMMAIEHQDAARHRVQDELDRGVDALVVPPDPDEEVHRDEHRVPEDVEQEQVERDEHAEHAGLEREDEEAELLHLLLDAVPRGQQRERREEAGEHDEPQADAVHAQVVVDAEGRESRAPARPAGSRPTSRRSARQTASVSANTTSEMPSAMPRTRPFRSPFLLGSASSRSAPMSGANTVRVRSGKVIARGSSPGPGGRP